MYQFTQTIYDQLLVFQFIQKEFLLENSRKL